MLASVAHLEVTALSRLFRALGDETRVRIVALLVHGELCVCHLESALGLSQPNASRQLGILKAAGVVESRRIGTWVYYQLTAQDDAAVKRVLAVLVKEFGAEDALRTDHARLRKRRGPAACSS